MPADLQNKTIDLLRSGMTRKEIAKFYDIPVNTVRIVIKRRNAETTNKGLIRKQGINYHLAPDVYDDYLILLVTTASNLYSTLLRTLKH